MQTAFHLGNISGVTCCNVAEWKIVHCYFPIADVRNTYCYGNQSIRRESLLQQYGLHGIVIYRKRPLVLLRIFAAL